jgi:hypothetical protein
VEHQRRGTVIAAKAEIHGAFWLAGNAKPGLRSAPKPADDFALRHHGRIQRTAITP